MVLPPARRLFGVEISIALPFCSIELASSAGSQTRPQVRAGIWQPCRQKKTLNLNPRAWMREGEP